MRKKLVFLVGAALLSGVYGSQAESSVYEINPIVVTATRTEINALDSNSNVNIVTSKNIEANHYKDLTEVLQTIPGVTVTRYGMGSGYEQAEGVLINGSNKVIVLIDGTRANLNGSEFASFYFGGLKNLDNIEKIEVLKGSASTLYGSDAKGGVISIITKKPGGGGKTTLGAERGSYDKEQYRISTSGKYDNLGYYVSLHKDISGTYSDAHGDKIPALSNTLTWNAKITGEINPKSDVTFAADRYTARYMYSGTNQKLTERHFGTANNLAWRMIYDYKANENLKNQFSIYSHSADTFYDGWLMDLETIGVSDQLTASLPGNHELIAGFDVYRNKVKDYLDQMGVAYKGKKLTNKAVFIQDRWNLTDTFNLTGGLRYTKHSMAGSDTSWSMTAGYDYDKNTNIYASYKQYFAAPTQYQYFSPFGNEKLKPEKGYTYEAGISHVFDDNFTAQFHVFRRKSKDVIAFAYGFPVTPSNPYGGRYVNVDRETSNGWDIQLNKTFTKNTALSVGYSHVEVKSQPKNKPENINRYIPKGEWHIGLIYDKAPLTASLLGHGVIDRPGEGKRNHKAFPCDTYWIWDASVNYKYNSDIKLYAKVNNIFNKFYAEHSNVKWGNPDEWYTSPGRNYIFGIEYSF